MTIPNPGRIGARFDDLTPGGASFELSEPEQEFVARAAGEVRGVLDAAEQAARRGGWVAGFVGYEAAAGLDPTLPVATRAADDPLAGLPLAWFGVFARRRSVAASFAEPFGIDAGSWTLDRDRAWHADAVDRIRGSIARGEYYQLNLTARLRGSVTDVERTYRALAAAQAGAHHAMVVTPDHTVISASPEMFFTRDGDRVTVRPMKGTAARGLWPAADDHAARMLRGSAKERAENTMIVDLLRNDLGRIARTGTVRAETLFDVERYPTVWQLTSTITADATETVGLVEVFTALFPSGSVTGAPKRAAMAAITDIEGRPRGVYCGAVGYLAPGPRPAVRFSVAIRTITHAVATGYAEYGTGGGITALSEADAEWSELLAKTAVLRVSPRPTALIETLRYEPPDRFVNLERHRHRLAASAAYFAFPDRTDAVRAALAAELRGRPDPGRVRITLTRAGVVAIEVADLPRPVDVVTVGFSDGPVHSADVLLYHKHSGRERYLRHRDSRPDLDDVILHNERGEVTEATTANLAVRLDGRWWTPPIRCGLLPGVERARLLDAGVLAERTITLDEARAATGLALVNSLRGWRTARLADDARRP